MTNLCEIPIGELGKSYILSVFDRIPGVCAEAGASVSQQGDCYAVLPRGTPLSRAEQFEAGGVVTEQSSTKWLEERIAFYAAGGKKGVILVQDLWAQPSDHLKRPPMFDWWTHDNEVYIWSEFGGASRSAVVELLREPISFKFAVFLVGNPELAESLKPGKGNVKEVAADVMELYVPAYDDESFIMWAR